MTTAERIARVLVGGVVGGVIVIAGATGWATVLAALLAIARYTGGWAMPRPR